MPTPPPVLPLPAGPSGEAHALLVTIVSSLIWAGGIALLATLAAWGLVLLLRRARAGLLVLCVPVLLPQYLVTFALTLLIEPRSPLGAWLALQGQGPRPWLPRFASQSLACVGLAAWLVPLGVLLLMPAARAIPASVDDALSLDAPRPARARVLLALLRPALLPVWGVLASLMLAGAVPLHLVNAPTLSVRVWASVALEPASLAPWVSAAPILLCGGSCAWWLSGRALRPLASAGESARTSRHEWIAIVLASLLSLVPVLAAFSKLHSLRSVVRLAEASMAGLLASMLVALAVGCVLAGLMVASWWVCSRAHGGRQGLGVRVLLAMLTLPVFVPGVLVGQAILRLARAFSLHDLAALGLAHCVRFVGLFALAGAVLAASEPRVRVDARALDGAAGLRGWWHAGPGAGRASAIIAAAGVGSVLSLHEIETAIILQPAGTGSLGQTMLAQLHFARSEELCAGVLLVTIISLVVLLLAGGVIAAARRLRE